MTRLASFHLATFPWQRSASKLISLPAERWEVAATPGCVLGKVLGTSRTGTTRISADLRRWAIFAVWENDDAYDDFTRHNAVFERWSSTATSFDSYLLQPVTSRGTWGGIDPFTAPTESAVTAPGKVAVLTRASVRWTKFGRFARAIGPVDDVLSEQRGCELALGIGEWPVGQQATFSVWSDSDAIERFAYGDRAHKEVIRSTYRENWYSEEMFSRFAVISDQSP